MPDGSAPAPLVAPASPASLVAPASPAPVVAPASPASLVAPASPAPVVAPASPASLVAARADSTGAVDGFGIAEDIRSLSGGVAGGGWIEGTIGGFAASVDVLAVVTDPAGALVSWGVSWLMEHVKPLSDALDWLAGDPDQIMAYARTWQNVAGAASSAASSLRDAVDRELAAWTGPAADAYRRHATSHLGALNAAAEAGNGLAVIVEGAGLLVALVRGLVRDLIADFVSVLAVRLWEWLAEEACTLGIATPWVVAQVSSLVGKWVAKITDLFRGLLASLRRLGGEIGSLTKLIEHIRGAL